MSNKKNFKWSEENIKTLLDLRLEGNMTWEEIAALFTGLTPNGARKAFNRLSGRTSVPKSSPKVLLLDIETAPIEAYVWGLFDQNISLEQILQDWAIISFSAKWLGSPEEEIMYFDNRGEKDPRDDRRILTILHSLLDEADVIIGQNSKRFDEKKINARFIMHGMSPPSSYKHIDTLQIAKRKFGFTSNKLAYMTSKLCTKYKKLDHGKFPGFKLWKECLAGNKAAWVEMEEYNRHDVLSLEELYLKLAPWDNVSVNFEIYHDDLIPRCNCGSSEFKNAGFHYTKRAKFQRYKCVACGKESRDSVNLLSKEKKTSLRS